MQNQIKWPLDGMKIRYAEIDVSLEQDALRRMRELMGNPLAEPPQIFNGDDYCGVSNPKDSLRASSLLGQLRKDYRRSSHCLLRSPIILSRLT